MASNFARAMTDSAKTWNGAVSLESPDITGETNGRVSLFFKAVRGLETSRLYEYLIKSAEENIIDTFLLVFHIRDCRGGKGERELGRLSLIWLFINYPKEFINVAPLISEYGRWDDLIELWPGVLNLTNDIIVKYNSKASLSQLQELQLSIVRIFGHQLTNDKFEMGAGNPTSICAKWAPTENDSYDRKYGVVDTLTKVMGITPKIYRKQYISPLRQYINVVERYMCEKNWDNIDYSKVPSCAMKRLKKAFEKHSPEQFSIWKNKLKNGEVTVKAKQLFPHELIHELRIKNYDDQVSEAQWKVLEEEAKKLGSLKDCVFVCDVSSSMLSWNNAICCKKNKSFCPMDVAIGLSLLGANTVEGQFHNHIITFSEKPTFHLVSDESLLIRYHKLKQANWGGSTNLQATFDLILQKATIHGLSQNDMPKRVFIISDMQFNVADCNSNCTNFQEIDRKYIACGYKRPDIVFWNVCGSSNDFPVSVADNGTALVSGFSPSIMTSFLHGNNFSPYLILRNVLDSPRFTPLLIALNNAFIN